MIVVCPSCTARFRVGAAALGGASGRRLRCANCGHLWRYRAAPTPAGPPTPAAVTVALAAGAEPLAADRLMPALIEPDPVHWPSASETIAIEALGLEVAATPPRLRRRPEGAAPVLRADMPSVSRLDAAPSRGGLEVPARRSTGGRRWRIAASLGLALIAAIVLVALLARDRLTAIWPAAERAPALAAIAPPTGAGLKVTLAPRRTSDSVVISGDIVNRTAVVRRLPRLRVTLRDRHETTLAAKVIDPPVLSLPPGASAHFNAVFEHPSGAATGVAVSFATD